MFRVDYEISNGYKCSCCRETWDSEKEFETKEELVEWLVDFYAGQEVPLYVDEDDREVVEISTYMYVEELKKVTKVDITDDIDNEVSNSDLVKKEIEKRKKQKEERENKKRIDQENKDKERRRKQYEELKKEFEK